MATDVAADSFEAFLLRIEEFHRLRPHFAPLTIVSLFDFMSPLLNLIQAIQRATEFVERHQRSPQEIDLAVSAAQNVEVWRLIASGALVLGSEIFKQNTQSRDACDQLAVAFPENIAKFAIVTIWFMHG